MASSSSTSDTDPEEIRELEEAVASLELHLSNGQLLMPEEEEDDDDDDEESKEEAPTVAQIALVAGIQEELAAHIRLVTTRIGFSSELKRRAALNDELKRLEKQHKTPKNMRKIQHLEQELSDTSGLEKLRVLNEKFVSAVAEIDARGGETQLDNIETMADSKCVLLSVFKTTIDLQRRAIEAVDEVAHLEKQIRERSLANIRMRKKLAQMPKQSAEDKATPEPAHPEKALGMLKELRDKPVRKASKAQRRRFRKNDAMIAQLEKENGTLNVKNDTLKTENEEKKKAPAAVVEK